MNIDNHRREDGTIDMLAASKEIFYERERESEQSYKENIWKKVESNFKVYFEMVEDIKPIKSRQVAAAAITNAFFLAEYVWPKHPPIYSEPMHYLGNGCWGLHDECDYEFSDDGDK